MIKRVFFGFLILVFFIGCIGGPDIQKIEQVVEEVGHGYAPDSRLEVWDITVGTNGPGITINGQTTTQQGFEALQSSLSKEFPNLQKQYDVLVLPDPVLGEKTKGIIRVPVGHVRLEPKNSAMLVAQGLLGAPVTLLKEDRGYYYMKMEDGYLGWLRKFSVIEHDAKTQSNWLESPLAVYNQKQGKIYEQPDRSSYPVSDIVMGARVKIKDSSPRWVRVELPDERAGFIPREELYTMNDFQEIEPQPENMVKTARQMLGVTYLWGGTSTNGFDCSGFTQTVMKMNGVNLPRDANMQVNEGTEIDTANHFAQLQPGDLLFFGRDSDRITHVGMYIGDQKFIHSSGMVKINSLDPAAPDYNEHRHKTLRYVKRMF